MLNRRLPQTAVRSVESAGELRARLQWVLLLFVAAELLIPKLLLIGHAKRLILFEIDWTDVPWLVAQDIVISLLVLGGLYALQRQRSYLASFGGLLVSATLLFFLMVDMRVRQMWLKPIDISLMRYARAHFGTLSSDADYFLDVSAGSDSSFALTLTLLLGLHLCLGVTLVALGRSRPPARLPHALLILAPLATLALAVVGPAYSYQLQRNPITSIALDLVRVAEHDHDELRRRAAAFDQPARPLGPRRRPRQRLATAARFESLIVYVLESFRSKDLALDDPSLPTPAPTLRRLAAEGLLVHTQVSVPHSTKSHFSIFTGRYPYPGIEIREASGRHASLVRSLREQQSASTIALSTAYLPFENMDGLLEGLGFEQRVQLGGRAASPDGVRATGLRLIDEALYEELTDHLPARPFVVAFFPVAAHIPYDYPGKSDPASSTHEDYLKSVTYADAILEHLMQRLAEGGHLDDTLVVITGDHGESFGEHGSVGHASSLYGDETLVPTVFWSNDGRLRSDSTIDGRQIDIAPTVADLMGLVDATLPVQGESLLRHSARPAYGATFFDRVALSLVEGGQKFVFEPATGSVTRFDLASDPNEQTPLVVPADQARMIAARVQAFDAYSRLAFGEP